jgi:hypothetical protein
MTPMTESQEYRRIFPIFFHYTLPIWDTTKQAIGAGVLIEIKDRLFVATAAHCMPQNGFCIVDEKGFPYPYRGPGVVTDCRHKPHPQIDIGYLELDKTDQERLRALNRSYCSLSQLSTDAISHGGMVHVLGYPVDTIVRDHQTRTFNLSKMAFGSPFQVPVGDYLTLNYPLMGWRHSVSDTEWEEQKFPTTPNGFSGGGWWVFHRPAPGELFNPAKHVKLVGIQSSWNFVHRVVNGVPIIRLLELIHEDYPDLRQELEQEFPVLLGA